MKAVGEESGSSESASGINLPSFTYEILFKVRFVKLLSVRVGIDTLFKLDCGFFSKLGRINFRCSLLISTVSKEPKEEDRENHQSVLWAIVNKVLERSGIRGVIIKTKI